MGGVIFQIILLITAICGEIPTAPWRVEDLDGDKKGYLRNIELGCLLSGNQTDYEWVLTLSAEFNTTASEGLIRATR